MKIALSTSLGNSNHVAVAKVIRHSGVDTKVPNIRVFDTALDAVADVVAGHADVGAITAASPVPELAAGRLRAIGISSKARVGGPYAGTPTTTPWLNEPMTITDWGHRGVPNVLLNAALTSKAIPSKVAGTWNAAHFKNKKYDALVKAFGATPALADQKKIAKAIELLLLAETPVIFPYFYNSFNAGSKKVKGYQVDQLGEIYRSKTSLS